MSDLISRQAAIDVPEKFIKDCNPEHFVGHQKFIEYMDDAEIGSFGNWQFANGFNMGLTAAEVAINKLPSAQPEIIRCKDCKHRPKKNEYSSDLEFPDDECICQCADYYYDWMPEDDFYCARGERRSEDD